MSLLSEKTSEKVTYQIWGVFGESGEFHFFQNITDPEPIDQSHAVEMFEDYVRKHGDTLWQLRRLEHSTATREYLTAQAKMELIRVEVPEA